MKTEANPHLRFAKPRSPGSGALVYRLVLAALLVIPLLSGCSVSVTPRTAPDCRAWERLGLIAETVPSASYVPCIATTPPGWESKGFVARDTGTTFSLLSDRAQGRAVAVSFRRTCSTAGATPIPPRTAGGRSMLQLRSIEPRYAGTMFDVFPGGCVTYRFDFGREAHIALMAELQEQVALVPRDAVRRELRRILDVELGP